jgi:hypothetical protein
MPALSMSAFRGEADTPRPAIQGPLMTQMYGPAVRRKRLSAMVRLVLR